VRRCEVRRLGPLLVLAAMALGGLACGRSPSAPTPQKPIGQLSDPSGDTTTSPFFSGVSPDLTSAMLAVSNDDFLTITIQFTPGTFDPTNTVLEVRLNTDHNAAPSGLFGGTATDYSVLMSFAFGRSTSISYPFGGSSSSIRSISSLTDSSVPTPVARADGCEIRIPLSMLGNDDGRMAVRILSHADVSARLGPGTRTVALDVMPDLTSPPGTVQ
jgi:hypothetical protein